MSPSRLHHHFRQFTSMSPLQFQKWLRLAEARRLMVVQGMAPSIAAYEVGYGSPSQFSREYARMFGTSPRRDVLELTKEVSA
ncbi:helix-turn-helix domain-containing protein [Paraburkholderia caledonica]